MATGGADEELQRREFVAVLGGAVAAWLLAAIGNVNAIFVDLATGLQYGAVDSTRGRPDRSEAQKQDKDDDDDSD
jgi:hypothetical protein